MIRDSNEVMWSVAQPEGVHCIGDVVGVKFMPIIAKPEQYSLFSDRTLYYDEKRRLSKYTCI